jgi:Tol biopolymer transport system component
MSWSFDNNKLSVICGEKLEETILCVLEVDGKTTCYPETSDMKIIYAAWSPVNDTLAISTTTYDNDAVTYLFTPETNSYQFLFTGFFPAWSPSGNKIASFFYVAETHLYGIQVYTMEDRKTSVLLPNEKSKEAGFFVLPTVAERDDECVISWSPDEKQLVFSSWRGIYSNQALLLYDFQTKEFELLTDPILFQESQMIPQWSTYQLIRQK